MNWKSWFRRFRPAKRQEEKGPPGPPATALPVERPSPRPRLTVGWATDVGRQRSHNEDTVLIAELEQAGYYGTPSTALLVLADGMGGHLAGEVASALATRAAAQHILQACLTLLPIREHSASEPSLKEVLIEAFQRANELVTERVPGGGTTLLCALILGNRAYIANVGDSRAYLVSPEGCRQITRDHSIVDIMVELGQMTSEEAVHHPQRNVLYRAVGQRGPLEVDTFLCHIPPGGVLLLCSDGLWEMVSEEEMVQVVATSSSLQEACDILVEKANQAGGKDNISVILAAPPEIVDSEFHWPEI
ncbi:MAG: Stp1/IreP family PP2C-type Ser/Thr phosphatase [Thermoflexales bacterium]|nr:Stp1/IreP family PP2C-type Ser/Thr phosphatase [Thermoflexales bacterium]